MAIGLMVLAAVFVSISNFFMRRSIDAGGTTKGFLVFQMTMALGVAVLLNPVRTGEYSCNAPIAILGLAAGLVLAALLFVLGRALEEGPPGLTFSILNASTVMPGVAMALFFGFPYTSWHAVGSLLVLGGLFWAGKGLEGLRDRRRWIAFSLLMFALHMVLLTLFQWRAFLLNAPNPGPLFAIDEIQSQWFMPIMFCTSALVQAVLFCSFEKRWPYSREISCGLMGGVANGICTYLMLWSTEVATPVEGAVIFPIFSVMGILLSNFWGQRLYQEKVNWRACQVAALGLIVGTVDWPSIIGL